MVALRPGVPQSRPAEVGVNALVKFLQFFKTPSRRVRSRRWKVVCFELENHRAVIGGRTWRTNSGSARTSITDRRSSTPPRPASTRSSRRCRSRAKTVSATASRALQRCLSELRTRASLRCLSHFRGISVENRVTKVVLYDRFEEVRCQLAFRDTHQCSVVLQLAENCFRNRKAHMDLLFPDRLRLIFSCEHLTRKVPIVQPTLSAIS